MVFETIVIEFLNKFLKQYIENLDTSQLKIGIWGGDVFLSELKIKTTLFDDLNLPIKIKWGVLGKFFLKIPWKNLYSSNVVVEIENLLMVIVPNSEIKYDPVKEEKWAQENKQKKLKAIEEAKKRELEGMTAKENDSFVEKLLTQIIKNLQIVIKNVHIRYEDNSTIPGSPFSVGVTLGNLSAQTTDEDPTLKFSKTAQGTENFICKVVDLEGLAIYWNTSSALFSNLAPKSLANILLESIPKADFKPEGYLYMFGPLSVSAFLRLNPKPESSACNFTVPKIFCNVHLKEIELAVTHYQFCEVISFLQNIQRLKKAAKYKKYKPVGIPVVNHAKEWWRFAYLAVVEDISRRRREWTWENIINHRKMCRRYAELFRLKLNSKKLSPSLLNEFKELEKHLNVLNLVLIREQVYVEVERNQKKKVVKSGGWFSSWFGYGNETETSPDEEHLVKKIESVMNFEEKQKLYKAIGYEESAPPTSYPITFVEVQFWFHLDEIKLTVFNGVMNALTPLMVVSVKSLRVEFEQRPSAFAMKLVMMVGKFRVTGKKEADKKLPVLVTSNCKESESLIEILYETKPLDSNCDQRVIVNANPLSIVYHAATINLVRHVFITEDSEEMEKIVAATSASLPDFPKITSLGLQYAIEKQTVMEVKVNIMSSYLIIPYEGVFEPDRDMLVIMLGKLSIESQESNRDVSVKKLYLEGTTDEEIFSAVVSASYTNFVCHLKGVQVLFQLSGEDWMTESKKHKSSLQFLEPTNLEVTIKKSLVTDDPRIPKMIIEGKLPSITINFSEERFMSFVALAFSIPTKTDGSLATSKKKIYSSSWSVHSLGTQLETKFVSRQKNIQHLRDSVEYVQGIDLVGHFEMSELKVNVSKSKETQMKVQKKGQQLISEEFLTVRIIKLEIELTRKTFETMNLLKLGGIDVRQYLKKKMLPFVATKGCESDRYLFVAEYINLDTRIPDFYSSRNGIINRLTLNVTPLNVLLNQEAILDLITFVTNVQTKVDLAKTNADNFWTVSEYEKAKEIREAESGHLDKKVIGKGKTFRRKTFQKEVIDFFLQASLDELDIALEMEKSSGKTGLAEFSVKGASVNISTRMSGTTLDLNIREVLLLDLNHLTKHKKIVTSLEKQTLTCRITLYNKDYFGTENTLDGSVDADVGCIQITFVNIFFTRALEFLNAFHFRESLKETASLAAQKAKDNMMKAFQNSAQICLNVRITAPLIIIPKSSSQLNVLILDMGVLTLKNSISELDYSSEKQVEKNPVVETLGLHLQNLKAARCTLSEDDMEVKKEVSFLVPVSFELTIKRNLSHIWFKLIPDLEIFVHLATVHVTLTHEDLCIITDVIKGNLSEGGKSRKNGKHSPQKARLKTPRPSKYGTHPQEFMNEENVKMDSTGYHAVIKFTFFLESFVFEANVKNLIEEEEEEIVGLAKFVMEAITLKGRLFSNNSIQTSIVLMSCLLNDMRPGKEGRLTRLMERTVDSNLEVSEAEKNHMKNMVEVVFQKNQMDTFVDVRVCKITLIISMDFLKKLIMFFTPENIMSQEMDNAIESYELGIIREHKRQTRELQKPIEEESVQKTAEDDKDQKYLKREKKHGEVKGHSKNWFQEPEEEEEEEGEDLSTFTINLRVEKPDIIIVERMDSINTDALIFHTEIIIKYRFACKKKIITATVTDMELYSCCFNPDKRPQTLNQVIKPFTISVAGSTPENSGLHIDICSTNICIMFNPNTVDLISNCCETFFKDTSFDQESITDIDYSDLWHVKPFNPGSHWFLKTVTIKKKGNLQESDRKQLSFSPVDEEGVDALENVKYSISLKSIDSFSVSEICLLAIPSIKILIEELSSSGTHPMLLLEMGFQMQCFNWSQRMSITSSLSIEAKYHNNELSVWEPFIEPVEKFSDSKKTFFYKPWEIFCHITFGDEGDIDGLRPPKVQVTLSCEETLQLCLTRTNIDVLKFALDTYTNDERRKNSMSTIKNLPPYVVRNETGLAIELLLDQSELKAFKDFGNEHNIILLDPGSEVELRNAFSIPPDLVRNYSTLETRTRLYVKFPIAENHTFELHLDSISKRCYPFSSKNSPTDFQCLVSDVSVSEFTTTVILRSALQVVNYFNEAINLHYLSEDEISAEYAGTVEGNSSFNVPFQAVYNEEKSLFFSINGYSLSSEPFVWKNLKKELSKSALVQCTSKVSENRDPFFIQVTGKIKPIYFANTKQKIANSVEFKIYLQPTLKIFNSLPVPLIFHFQGSASDNLLQPGHHMVITNAEPGLSTMTLRISNYLEKEWSCKEIFQENPPEFFIWEFVSYNGLAPETLNLGVYLTYLKKTAVYTIYSPYFMVNKTELLLSYRFNQGSTVFYHPGDLKAPLMLSIPGKKFFSKKSLFLQVNSSSWSDKFPIDVAGSGGTVECEDPASGITYRISVTITLTYNGLTKIVLFTPFYVLLNSMRDSIECQECDLSKEQWLNISPNSCAPFWPQSTAVKKTIRVRPADSNAVTPPFTYDTNDACLLRLSHKNGGIFVNIKCTPSGNCITFTSYEPGKAPVLIVNYSTKVISVYENGTSFCLTLNPSEEVMHAWVEPTGKRNIILMSLKNTKNVIPLDEDVEGLVFTSKGEAVRYVSFLDGTQRTLVFTEDFELSRSISTMKMTGSGVEVICKIHGIGISLVNNISRLEILYMSLLSSDISWEVRKAKKRRFKKLNPKVCWAIEEAYQKYLEDRESLLDVEPIVNVTEEISIDFLSMKILDPNPSDLKRTFEPGFYLAYRQIEDQMMVHVKVNRIQIDNQLHDCIFPVVLAPIPPPKTVAASHLGPRPFVEVSIVKITDRHSDVKQYKYFKTLVQEFHIRIDIGFLHEVVEFLASKPLSDEEHATHFKKNIMFMEQPLKSHVEIISHKEQKNFYELLHFSPLKIHFSFSLAGSFESNAFLPPKFGVLVQSVGVTLADVNDVIIRLSFLEKKSEFLTNTELINEVTSHYYGQIIRQVHVLLLGLDVIGNPYGLFVGIGQGVEDFFYEPFQGMIQGPWEFGKGMAIGCKSLFGHTVGSAAGSLGKLTGTLGKGLAVLSLDKEYQMQRMMNQHQQGDIQASMARGGKGLLMGVVEGVTGVVQKPIKGAKEEGVGGFFKGMGKGMMGLVTRPVSGVVDFASTSLNAVNRASKANYENKRVRPPRFFRDENIVKPYCLRDAEGNEIFKSMGKQKFGSTDRYEFHLRMNSKEIVILTNKRIIFAEFSDVFETWQVHLTIAWHSMPERPHSHTKGVALTVPRKGGSFKKDKPDVKVLLIEESYLREEMCKKMVELYQSEKKENEETEAYEVNS